MRNENPLALIPLIATGIPDRFQGVPVHVHTLHFIDRIGGLQHLTVIDNAIPIEIRPQHTVHFDDGIPLECN